MSDDLETDYENITDNYKPREGTLNERLTYMKALRHANVDLHKYSGKKNSDVFLQMIDLDKGIYGQPFLVSLFIHVSYVLSSLSSSPSSNIYLIAFYLVKAHLTKSYWIYI